MKKIDVGYKFIFGIFAFSALLFGSLFFSVSAANATIISSDVLQYYPFDGTGSAVEYEYFHSTSTTYQLTKSEHNGKTISYTVGGKFAGGVESTNNDGSSSDGACFYTSSLANKVSGEFAYSVWYKTSNTNPYGHIFSNWENANGRLDLRNNGSESYFSFYDGSSWRDFNISAALKDGNWHSIVIQGTYGSLNTDSQTYIDGDLVSSNWGAPYSPASSGHYQVLTIGGSSNVGAPEYCKYAFSGAIDEFVAYNRKLTQFEINSLLYDPLSDILNPPPSGLTIAINDFDANTQRLHLYGLCNQNGSGINQMRIVGLADNATTSQPVLPDPLGVWRGSLVDCDGTYNAYYDGGGLTGTHWVAVDDTFYGTQWVVWEQDFNASSTPDWEFSYGYMSQDDPEGTASRLACSDTEWATPDPVIGIDWLSATTSVPAFNFTKIKCNIAKQWYIAMFSVRDQAKVAGNNAALALGQIFPFNFSKAIQNSWAQSASSTLPSGLEFLNSEDSNGNITVPITIGQSTSSIPIWGNAIFKNSSSTEAAYTGIRTVSTWLIRLAFFALVILLGSKIYHEFNQTRQ